MISRIPKVFNMSIAINQAVCLLFAARQRAKPFHRRDQIYKTKSKAGFICGNIFGLIYQYNSIHMQIRQKLVKLTYASGYL